MFGELERCARCHRRYPAPLGHRCPHASFTEQREQDVEQGFWAWLETSEGQFAEWLARSERAA
jgi:hypothetical protein